MLTDGKHVHGYVCVFIYILPVSSPNDKSR